MYKKIKGQNCTQVLRQSCRDCTHMTWLMTGTKINSRLTSRKTTHRSPDIHEHLVVVLVVLPDISP